MQHFAARHFAGRHFASGQMHGGVVGAGRHFGQNHFAARHFAAEHLHGSDAIPVPVPDVIVPTTGGGESKRRRERNRIARRHPYWPYVPPGWKPGDPVEKPKPRRIAARAEVERAPLPRMDWLDDPAAAVARLDEIARAAVERAQAVRDAALVAAGPSIMGQIAEADALEAQVEALEPMIAAAQEAYLDDWAARVLLLVA